MPDDLPEKRVVNMPTVLQTEREELAALCKTLQPVIDALAKDVAKRKKGERHISGKEDMTLRAYERLVNLRIKAVKAEAEIKKMDSDRVSMADIDRVVGVVLSVARRGFSFAEINSHKGLTELFDTGLFRTTTLTPIHYERIIEAAMSPVKFAKEELPGVVKQETAWFFRRGSGDGSSN